MNSAHDQTPEKPIGENAAHERRETTRTSIADSMTFAQGKRRQEGELLGQGSVCVLIILAEMIVTRGCRTAPSHPNVLTKKGIETISAFVFVTRGRWLMLFHAENVQRPGTIYSVLCPAHAAQISAGEDGSRCLSDGATALTAAREGRGWRLSLDGDYFCRDNCEDRFPTWRSNQSGDFVIHRHDNDCVVA